MGIRSSYLTLIPSVRSDFSKGSTVAEITANCSADLNTGTITTWTGASFGGRTSPLSSECAMIRAPIKRVETPHEVAHTYSSWFSLLRNFTSNALAKFCPRKWEVPVCNAFPSCIRIQWHMYRVPLQNVRQDSLILLGQGQPSSSRQNRNRHSAFFLLLLLLHLVAWAVCPSCQRNSAVRRNNLVRISHRTTFAHWLIRIGRSLYDFIQFL